MSLRVMRSKVVLALYALVAVAVGGCSDDFAAPPLNPPHDNRPPVLGHPSAVTALNTPVVLDLLAGASDPDGDPLTVAYATTDSLASIDLDRDRGTVTVTPWFSQTGTVQIMYEVEDTDFHLVKGTALVTVDNRPTAIGDQRSVIQDTPSVLTLQGSDADRDALTFSVVTQPQNGTLSGRAPDLTYTPAPGFTGTDSFTFSASDGHLTSELATISLTVTRLNHPPVATAQSIDATEDTSVAIALAGVDADGDPLTFQVRMTPSNGTVTVNGDQAIYIPAVNYHGPDSFTFVATDGRATSAPATVSIAVASVNDPPVAFLIQRSLNEDSPAAITLLATDADADPLTFAIQDGPHHGTVTGTLPAATYTPDLNYNGPDSFTYTASDGVAISAPATVTLSVNAVNDAPVAINGSVTTAEDTPVTITLHATDVDSDVATLAYAIVTSPSDGTLTGRGASWTYTPAPNKNGSRSFTFRAIDNLAATSNTATVSITITPVNDPPSAADDYVATDPGIPLAINPVVNDTDVEGDTLAIVDAPDPAHGTVEITGERQLVYTPDADFTGVDVFTYTVADPSGATSTATVHVGVGQFPEGAPTETILALAVSPSDNHTAASLSGDGRYIAFTTSSGLVPEDTNGLLDIYLYDRGTRTVTRVSQASDGGPANGPSRSARISADGRYVVFESLANNLVPGDTNSAIDVFRHDRLTGETVRVSVATGGGQATGNCTDPQISEDGRMVAFASTAFDLVASDENGASDIFVRDLTAGTTERVSVSTTGRDADLPSTEPAISGDGRFVAFTSPATNLVAGDTNLVSDVFVRDLVAGTTARASVSSTGGEANMASTGASLSRDGRLVSFLSSATNLVTGASGTQVYVRNAQALTTIRPLSSTLTWARLSPDGRYLAALGATGVSICNLLAASTVAPAGASTWLWPSFSGNSRYLVVLNAPNAGSLIVTPNPL